MTRTIHSKSRKQVAAYAMKRRNGCKVRERGERTSNLVEYLDDIECVATNRAAICFLRPFPQTFIVQNMIAGFDESNRLWGRGCAGMGRWQVLGRCRHCSRISKSMVDAGVRNDIQVLQTDNALVSHADKGICETGRR